MKANYLWSLVGLVLLAITSLAQTDIPAKEGYRVTASATGITLTKGQNDSVKVSIVRSKAFKTGKESLSFNAPSEAGLVVSVKQRRERPDEFIIYLSAPADAKSGEYNLVPVCTLRNKSKGVVINLKIK